ncbi:luminal-binding protein [Musa troglodytarum]|uniref:Luminal-binding protein n=1 Tax=Musa troglodytarum TaxID=320322 RepID=A0A9E7G2M0_9LILI|nr:luminal-binding protein [Musa troglodytarum]
MAPKPVPEAHIEKPRNSCCGVRDRLVTVNPRPPPRPPVPDSTNFRAMYFWLQKGDRGGYVLGSIVCENFDQRIIEYFIKLIKKKHGKDNSKDNRALGKLRRECERAKRALSNQHLVRMEIVSLGWFGLL